MNTYKITFQRENGTVGSDKFTTATEREARREFGEVYRHGNGKIVSVELVSSDAPATKEQELKALAQIKQIVSSLGGAESYVGMAFEGCFEIAEDNIGNDFGCSMKQRAEAAEKEAQHYKDIANYSSNELDKALEEIARLRKQLEAEQEWQDYEMDDNVSQSDYDNLAKAAGTRYLTDDEAKDLLYDWFGFAKEKITIHRSVPTYQKNRHNQLRRKGTADRRPAYNSTDWNYIRFDCGACCYELHNDTLSFFMH